MTGWPAFCLITFGIPGGIIAWGFWCQRQLDRADAEAARRRMHEDVRAALLYRDAYNAAVDMERDLTEWERELQS